MNACVIVGSVCPTFSVPGIRRSGTILKNLNMAVVGANDPMPSVSKKLVTKPMPSCAGFGLWPPVTASGAAPGVAFAFLSSDPGTEVIESERAQRSEQPSQC